MSSLLESLQWRYATKQFDPSKKITDTDLHQLTEALRLSPSSFGLQPRKFLIVTDPAIRETLVGHSRGQRQVADASHLIVLCARDGVDEAYIESYIADVAQTRGIDASMLDGYKHMMIGFSQNHSPDSIKIRADKQVYIAQGVLLTAAAMMQIDACPMEWFDRGQYDTVLGLEGTGYHTAVIVPVGYRSADDVSAHYAKVRFSEEEVVEYR